MGLLLEDGEIGKLVQGKTFVDPTADLVKNDPWNGRELSDDEAMRMGLPVAPDPVSSLRDSYRKAMFEVNPDQAAFTQRLTDETGAPGWMIDEYPDARKLAENELKLKETPEPDWDALVKKNPGVANYLGAHMDFSHDDIDNLVTIEDGLGALSEIWSRGKRGYNTTQLGKVGVQQIVGDDSPETEKRAKELEGKLNVPPGDHGLFLNMAGGLAEVMGQWGANAPLTATLASAAVVMATLSGVGTVPALGAAGSFAGAAGGAAFAGIAGSMYGSFATEAGNAYREFITLTDEKGMPLDRDAARVAAILVGLANAGIEVAQMSELAKPFMRLGMNPRSATRAAVAEMLKSPTTRAAFVNFFKNYGKVLASEVAQEGLQELGTILGGGLAQVLGGSNQSINWDDAAARVFDTVKQSAVMFGFVPALGAGTSFVSDYGRAVHAQQVQQTFSAIADASKRSKTMARLPRAFSDFIERATRGKEPGTVYVPSRVFDLAFNQGPVEVARELGIEQEYNDAKATQGEIAIPVSTFAAKVAPTDAFQVMADDLRIGEDTLTANEARAKLEELQATQEKRMEEAREAIAREDAWGEELRQVHQEVKDMRKMADANATDEEADADALVFSQFVHVLATRRKQTPIQAYESLGLRIREGLPGEGGATFDQQGRPWEMDPDARAKFYHERVGQAQRGGPERAMVKASHALGGGVMSSAIEHIGDLTHRMSQYNAYDPGNHSLVKEKVDKAIRWLTDPYGFMKEHEENLRSNARFAVEHGYVKSEEEYHKNVENALAYYRDQHRMVPAYNRVQYLGREAAIAVARGNVDEAVKYLKELQGYLDEGQESWQKRAMEADPTFNQVDVTSPAFRAWFGKSVVVKEDGTPMVVYHGTSAKIGSDFAFETGRASSRIYGLAKSDVNTQALFFTNNTVDASGYGPNIVPCYLSIQNPLQDPSQIAPSSRSSEADKARAAQVYEDLEYILEPAIYEDDGKRYIDIDNGVSRRLVDPDGDWVNGVFADGMIDWALMDNPEIVSRMKERGYDGVKVYEPGDAAEFSWAVFSPTQVKAVNNNGAWDPNDPRIFNQYAGQRADVTPAGLGEAYAMLKAGATNNDIRLKTGWFFGMDGEPRFEINDSDAKFKKTLVGETKLGALIDFPALFLAYPGLADIDVFLDHTLGDGTGEYYPSVDAIHLGYEPDPVRRMGILLHEVQHAIQDREEFANGGSIQLATTALWKNTRWGNYLIVESALKEINAALADGKDQVVLSDKDGQPVVVEGRSAIAKLEGELRQKMSRQALYDTYRKFAGEIEAWDVTNRHGMTYGERLDVSPDLVSDAIIVRRGKIKSFGSSPLMPQMAIDEDDLWADWEPDIASTGKIYGAPEWVKDRSDLRKMRQTLRDLVWEGAAGRYWYEDSARAAMEIAQQDPVEAEKIIQLLAIYSAHTQVGTNTISAIRAYTQFKNGTPEEKFHVAMGSMDSKAIDLLYHGNGWDGRKTDSFYKNLMHDVLERHPESIDLLHLDNDLVDQIRNVVTVDMWVYRAFGYDSEQGTDDLGRGKYSFAENEIRKIAAQLNRTQPDGAPLWTPYQVQAALWTGIRARYSLPSVKAATIRKSVKAGLTTMDDNGKLSYPKSGEDKKKHLAIWRKEAMKVPTSRMREADKAASISFADHLKRMTEMVTWEAVPSSDLNTEIMGASKEVIAQFTAEAQRLLLDEDGNDLLAKALGVPINWSERSAGAFEGDVKPNVVTRILPVKPSGSFSKEEVQAYARAIQYIYRQDAVPWFRPDAMAMNAKLARKEQAFQIVKKKTGRAIPRGSFETLAEAQAKLATMKAGHAIRGGKYAVGVALRFDRRFDAELHTNVLNLLMEKLGPGAGYTRTAPDEIVVINYRDDSTGIPFLDDEVFMGGIQTLVGEHGGTLGVAEIHNFWSEGEYGYVHNWRTDPEGQAILNHASLAGRPDLHSWIRGRREAFDKLLEEYSGERLQLREQEAHTLERFYQSRTGTTPQLVLRGNVLFSKGSTIVSLFKGAADRSTFVHEVGHIMLKTLEEDVRGGMVDPEVAADFQTVLDWLGVAPGEAISEKQHERFAEAFEDYLMGGKAPVVGLRRVFALFKDWLKGVYGALRGSNVDLSPEITEVFDRLIATDDQIQATKELDGFNDLIAQEAGVLSEPETVFLKTLAEQAEAEAEARLRKKAMKDVEFERKAAKEERRLELTNEIYKEVEKSPVEKLRQVLRMPVKQGGRRISLETAIEAMEDLVQQAGWDEGSAPGQTAEEQLEVMRSRRESIRKELRDVKKALAQAEETKAPRGRVNYLKSRMHALENDIATINDQLKPIAAFERKERKGMQIPSLPRQWFVNEGGMDIEDLAKEHGYTSGSELLEDLMSAPEIDDEVKLRVDKKIQEEFPVTSQEELEEEANRALHNKHRLEFLAVERMVLARLTKREMRLEEAKSRVEGARKAARKILGLKVWRAAGAWKRFLAAERRAQKDVERAMLAGDYETALQLKDVQILQHALCLESMEISDKNGRMIRFLKKYANRKRTETFGLPADYLDQIDRILERYSFRPVKLVSAIDPQTGEKLKGGLEAERQVRESLKTWAAAQEAQGFPVDIPDYILEEINRKPFTEITYEELVDVAQTVHGIETMGLIQKALLSLERQESLDTAVARLVRSAEAHVPLERAWHTSSNPNSTLVQKLKDLNDSKDAQLTKVQQILLYLDGVKGSEAPGAWTELLWSPFRKASIAKHELMVQSGEELSALLKRHYKKGEWKKFLHRKTFITSLGYSLTGEQILCTGLNWGNEKNRQRLMDGKEWDYNQVNEVLSHLAKRDWDFIQGVWDHLQSFWPLIVELDRELVGYAPVQEEASPVVTIHGVYRGGYYPLGADYTKRVKDFHQDPDKTESLMKRAGGYRTATRNGFTKARAQESQYQLRLDLGVLYRHIDDVLHDLTHRKAVIDARRILANEDLRKHVVPRLGRELFEAIVHWVDDVGVPPRGSHDVGSKFFRVVRRHVTVASLMFKTTVHLLQGLGIFSTAGVLKARTINAIGMYYMRPWRWYGDWKKAYELSAFLQERAGVVDDNVREVLDNAYGDKEGPVKLAARHFFNLFDGLVTIPTWWEGYRMGLLKYNGDQEKAVGYADDLVRQTQGGVGTLDSSEFQRSTSEWKRAFGMFYSYFNMLFGQMWKARRSVHGVKDLPAYVGTMALIWIAPAVLEEAIRGELPDEEDRDDPLEWLKWLASTTISYWAGTMPVVRESIPYLMAKATGYGYGRMRTTPVANVLEVLGKTVEKGTKWMADEAELRDVLEAGAKVAAYAAPYPMQFNAIAWAVIDWLDGEDSDVVWQRIIWGRSRSKK